MECGAERPSDGATAKAALRVPSLPREPATGCSLATRKNLTILSQSYWHISTCMYKTNW